MTYYKCVTSCGTKYIDAITDPDNPTCADSCPSGSYIDELTYGASKKVCTKSCRNLVPVACVDASDAANKKCTRACAKVA